VATGNVALNCGAEMILGTAQDGSRGSASGDLALYWMLQGKVSKWAQPASSTTSRQLALFLQLAHFLQSHGLNLFSLQRL
jgi:hypothetical protein